MINLKSKGDCCGCYACENVCPVSCISMQADEEGFFFPKVDVQKCINCSLCEKVCPVIQKGFSAKNASDFLETPVVYAARTKDTEVLSKSSSGGIFSILAGSVLAENGVVFGALWDENWKLKHSFIEDISALPAMRGSKYLQSAIGSSYKDAKAFLDSGRLVLFSGTPCQIAGLKNFLRKPYPNLLAVEIICHGVPSQKYFDIYIDEFLEIHSKESLLKKSDLKSVFFRDKSLLGWKSFSFKMNFRTFELVETLKENIYLRGFLGDLCLRDSCFDCPAKSAKSGADMTLGDFWTYSYLQFNDNKGVSAVLIRTQLGTDIFEKNKNLMDFHSATYADVFKGNTMLEKSVSRPDARKNFFAKVNKKSLHKVVENMTSRTFFRRLQRLILKKINLSIDTLKKKLGL